MTETRWTLTPRMFETTSRVNMVRQTCDMVEISNAADGLPQTLIHLDNFGGDIYHRLSRGETVTVQIVDVDA